MHLLVTRSCTLSHYLSLKAFGFIDLVDFLMLYHINKSPFVFNIQVILWTTVSLVVVATITEEKYLQDRQLGISWCLLSQGTHSPAPLF